MYACCTPIVPFLSTSSLAQGGTQDGDITDTGNIRGYREYIRQFTPPEREGLLDVVVGDGGFGVTGEENLQE